MARGRYRGALRSHAVALTTNYPDLLAACTCLLSHISSGRGSAGRLPRRVSQEVAVKLLAKDAVSSEGRTGQGGLFCF